MVSKYRLINLIDKIDFQLKDNFFYQDLLSNIIVLKLKQRR